MPANLSTVLTDLSATVCRIRGLQQIHADDGLQSQLRRTAAEQETLIAALLHTDGAGSRPPAATRPSVSRPGQRAAEHALSVWLAVKDPAGPRCRSLRAAVSYLRDRDRVAWPDTSEVWR